MQRAVTAIYRTHQTAALVRNELDTLGVPRGYIHMIPETEDRLPEGSSRDVGPYNQEIHDLHLPEDDTRTYQQAVKNGDYIVSVDVEDNADLDRIKDIMRRPEDSRDIDALDTEYAGAEYIPFRHSDAPPYTEGQRGVRDPGSPGERGHLRGYTRSEPMRDRTRD
ncbi:hypothetical protein [Tranquillimonas alkanivorans]|uniref:Heat induced stress protein YflT n=1 Tax=Tranquillimonas alkanivorans TaxID=441119 RepID=A0A1I5KTJ3_9RHOB|nr:hypothetical protein [Tranquillimonas alkanivorans]SFO88268.1 hypothetical protein SAMN04488047_101300 [Tranquillimonas alkanivorans]